MGNPTSSPPPHMTSSDTYPLLSVHFDENLIVLAIWDKFEMPFFCHTRVTILVNFGAPYGQPHHPTTPLLTDSDSYLFPSVHFNANWIV